MRRPTPTASVFCRIGTSERQIEILSYADVERLADGNEFLSRYTRENWLLPLWRLRRYAARRMFAATRILSRASHAQRFAAAVRPGDVLINLGASWTHKNFAKTIGQLKRDFGMRFALLVHDVLPVSHPGYVDPRHIPTFSTWLAEMAQVWDFVMTPSKSSAAALASHLAAHRLPVPVITVIPFGAGFGISTDGAQDVAPQERTHVLYVSTIEIRKNHMLLFKVWERLIREHGLNTCLISSLPENMAGRSRICAPDAQGNRLSRWQDQGCRENLSDEALAVLYRSSLFTAFPSFCEGWGLPVAESLFYGRHYRIGRDVGSRSRRPVRAVPRPARRRHRLPTDRESHLRQIRALQMGKPDPLRLPAGAMAGHGGRDRRRRRRIRGQSRDIRQAPAIELQRAAGH